MNLSFFGAGLVEVPPEGHKRMKNSRRMQMVFFVHEGKVTVEVGDVRFGMSKGGVWQVPRGMFSCFSLVFFPLSCSASASFLLDFVSDARDGG